jgi:uncharacterized secreted protein with C-terminal beta-propeller domain
MAAKLPGVRLGRSLSWIRQFLFDGSAAMNLPLRGRRFGGLRAARHLRVESLESRWLMSAEGLDESIPPAPEYARFTSEAELRDYLIADALERYKDLFGERLADIRIYPWFGHLVDTSVVNFAVAQVSDTAYSKTNTQVAGVDEGDLVETDGVYLYTLAQGQLVIANVADAANMEISSQSPVKGNAFAMFLHGDRLTVLSHGIASGPNWEPGGPVWTSFDVGWASQSGVIVTVFDVSDRGAPTVLQETTLEGDYVSARAVGDSVFLVTSDSIGLPIPKLNCEDAPPGDYPFALGSSNCTYETRDEYLARIAGQEIALALPEYQGRAGDEEGSGVFTESTDVFHVVGEAWNLSSLLTISVFDTSEPTPGPAFSTIVPAGYSPTVYATDESLYVGSAASPGSNTESWNAAQQHTVLLKFDLGTEAHRVDFAASGAVRGTLLNQFSMDEYAGDLRVAMTEGWGTEAVNRVSVLRQAGDKLETIGRTSDFGQTETIHSVRFDGPRAWVVTFQRVDPVFSLDLSDPTAPQVKGELVIPGFSTYLQMIDENHVIGIGYDADPVTGRQGDAQIGLFDISNPLQPVRLASVSLGDRTFFLRDYHHHAYAYSTEHGVLSIPTAFVGNVWGRGGRWIEDTSASTLYSLSRWRIDPSAPAGSQIVPLDELYQDSNVTRSVRIDDVVYSISEDEILAHDIDATTATRLGRLAIPPAPREEGRIVPINPIVILPVTPLIDVMPTTIVEEPEPPLESELVESEPVMEAPVEQVPVVESPVVETPLLETPVEVTPVVSEPPVELPTIKQAEAKVEIDCEPVSALPEATVIAPPVVEPEIIEPTVHLPVMKTQVVARAATVLETVAFEKPVVTTPSARWDTAADLVFQQWFSAEEATALASAGRRVVRAGARR